MYNQRSLLDFPRNEAGLVDKFIGTAFDAVYNIYLNLEEILNSQGYANRAEAAQKAAELAAAAAEASEQAASASEIAAAESAANLAEAVLRAVEAQDAAALSAVAAAASAEVAHFYVGALLPPSAIAPTTRVDGTPLQPGDRYFNLTTNTEYLYRLGGWQSSSSMARLDELEAATVSSYAALQAYSGTQTTARIVAPEIGGEFRIRLKVSGDVVDNATIIESTGLPGYVWVRQLSNRLSMNWFIQGDAGIDASERGNVAAATAKRLGKALEVFGNFKLSAPIDFRDLNLIASASSFTLDTADQIGLILGGNASQSYNPEQKVGRVYRSDETMTTPTIRVMGAKGQRIFVGRTQYLQLFASTSAPDRNRNYSIAYSTFNLGHINKIELTNDSANAGGAADSNTGGTIQWINENVFNINRCHGLTISGTYTHNHNKFNGGTWEGPVVIDIQTGFCNYVLGGRFEEGPTTVKFGSKSANNWIQKTWDGTLDDRQSGLINGTVEDLGTANVVSDDFSDRHNVTCVAYASVTDPWLNFSVDFPARAPLLQRVGGTAGNAPVMSSDKIRIERNMEFYWAWQDHDAGDNPLYRPFLEFFDKNNMPINASTSWVMTPGAPTPSGNFLSTGTGVGTSNYWATITQAALDAGALFVRVGTRISGSQVANSIARTISIFCGTPPNVRYHGSVESKRQAVLAVTSPPTQGYVPVGFEAVNINTGERYIHTFAFETTNTEPVVAGTKTLTLASVTGIAIGDRVGINVDDRDTFWGTVQSIAGNVVTIATTITKASKVGSRMVFNRYITK